MELVPDATFCQGLGCRPIENVAMLASARASDIGSAFVKAKNAGSA
jgi:hypothetical protein